MTREEALIQLRLGPGINEDVSEEYDEATDIAIEALEQEPCGDCISREKAKQFLYERLDRLNDDELYDIFSRIVDDMYNELPSATPQQKMGRWINAYPNIEPNPMFMYGICSVCGFEQAISDKLNYCPNCGAIMEEVE